MPVKDIGYTDHSARLAGLTAQLKARGRTYADVRTWALATGEFKASDIPERGRNPHAIERFLTWFDAHEGTTVTANDGIATESTKVKNNYVLIVDGTARRHSVNVTKVSDGTETHIITVKGIRRS